MDGAVRRRTVCIWRPVTPVVFSLASDVIRRIHLCGEAGGIVLLDVFLRRGSLAKSSAGATPFADARGDAGLEGGGWSAPAV